MPSIGTFVSNPDALLADSKKEHKPAAFGDLTQLAIHTANTAIFLLWSKLLTCLLSRKYQNRSILTNYQLPRCNCEERGKHFWLVTLVMFVRGATRKSCFDDKPTTPPPPAASSCQLPLPPRMRGVEQRRSLEPPDPKKTTFGRGNLGLPEDLTWWRFCQFFPGN